MTQTTSSQTESSKDVLRVAIGAEDPLKATVAALVSSQVDMVCVTAVDQERRFSQTVERQKPEVLVVDLAWSDTALHCIERIMSTTPIPIVAVDTQVPTPPARVRAEMALALGAVSVIPPPERFSRRDPKWRKALVYELRTAAGVRVARCRASVCAAATAKPDTPFGNGSPRARRHREFVPEDSRAAYIAVGASTGGPPCIRTVLGQLHEHSPPTLVAQHMPSAFMPTFVDWLRTSLSVPVLEARDGIVAEAGHVYVTPGDRHLRVSHDGVLNVLDTSDVSPAAVDAEQDPPLPSVNLLFESLAKHAAPSVGVLLTGLGDDGASGLSQMRSAGHLTVAQDQESSLVFDMPRAAIERNAAVHVAHPTAISDSLGRLVHLREVTGKRRVSP